MHCRSCDSRFANEAKYFGHPVDKEGAVIPALDNWPLCENHYMIGVIAGWRPDLIPEQHKMYGV